MKVQIILLCFLIHADRVQANIQFQRNNGRIIATSGDCESIQQQKSSLSQWLQTLKEPQTCKFAEPRIRSSGAINFCDIDVTGCLPQQQHL